MSDLPRLNEVGSEDERALVRAARAYEPPAESRERLLVALGLTASSAIAASTVSAAQVAADASGAAQAASAGSVMATVKGGLSLKALLTVASVVVVGATASYGVYHREEPAPPVEGIAQPSHTQVPTSQTVEAPAKTAAIETATDTQNTKAASAEPTLKRVPRLHASAPERPSLADELRALDEARTALRNGDAARASVLLEVHQRRFTQPHLALEAEALRIRVLEALGNHPEARARARRFLAAHPQSLLAQRLREIAEVAEPNTADDNSKGSGNK